MTIAEQTHKDKVASTGCVICRAMDGRRVPGQVHHIAEGSEPRSDFMTACLCDDHHQGAVGIHGLGVKRFCNLFRLSNEYWLIELQNRFIAEDGK